MYVSNLALLNERVVVHSFAYLQAALHIYMYMSTYVIHALRNKSINNGPYNTWQ